MHSGLRAVPDIILPCSQVGDCTVDGLLSQYPLETCRALMDYSRAAVRHVMELQESYAIDCDLQAVRSGIMEGRSLQRHLGPGTCLGGQLAICSG